MPYLDEAQVEIQAIEWLKELDYDYVYGPDIGPESDYPERDDYAQVVLTERLREALGRINPDATPEIIEEAIRKVTRPESPSLIENNRRFHRMVTDGVDIPYVEDGQDRTFKVWLIDAHEVGNNEFVAINQFTVIEHKNRRPDVIVFVNGMPLVVVELKNPADEKATIKKAYNQLQTYKDDIPGLFVYNELLVISDGLAARAGTLSAGPDRFMAWRTIDGIMVAPPASIQLEVMIKGLFEKQRLIDYLMNFVVFEDDGAEIIKKAAAYHQYHAVNKALDCTIAASRPDGDQRIGVIWHTQGSGKSLTMAFYAGKLIKRPEMENPTIVVITDRNDLDDQLHGTFCGCKALLRQRPAQAGSRADLREKLKVVSGGIVFTTIQKFLPECRGDNHPELSDRRNIVVIADEAHRSQYDFIDGYARHMRDALPNASFIGFTGTPIERQDKSTQAVFGDHIDTYDIQRAVEDKATVRIYYESRLARIELNEAEKPTIDPEFEEITEAEEEENRRQRLRSKWASLEAMIGTEKRIKLVAEDLVEHFGLRLEIGIDGKALIVCMSRRICVDMYNAIVKLRPGWDGSDDSTGKIKVVMSGSASDEKSWQQHIRNKPGREMIAKRFKDPDDELKIVIVRDMWLTGFDCPCMHTMYVDKPMRGHGLMQAIARVNRVFKDKPGGLVVDYLGLADSLKRALANYTQSGGEGEATFDQEQAVEVMLEKFEIVRGILYGYDYLSIVYGETDNPMVGIAETMEYILSLEKGKDRFLKAVSELSKAFALSVPHDQALKIRDEVGFFQQVRAALIKSTTMESEKTYDEMETAIKQLVSRAVISDEVVDIFAAAGLDKPDISILSDEFLAEVKQLPQKNLALELLKKLINDEIRVRSKKNLVQARSFSEMLEEAVRKYQNRAIEAAEVIDELIKLAKEMRRAQDRGEQLGLTDDEIAFYDALETSDSSVQLLGDDTLKLIAQELVEKVRKSVSIDWTVRENARAQIRVMVKRILRKYGYPPDKQEKATQTVLKQAELLCQDWAA